MTPVSASQVPYQVLNQAKPAIGWNAFSDDRVLVALAERHVPWVKDKAAALGAFAGDEATQELARLANRHTPELKTHDRFGNRIDPFTGMRDFHPGIDISVPRGTRVSAPADGVVVFCGTKGGYGNIIAIDHGYGTVTRYGHLDGFNVRPGQRVKRGDVIGFSGNTGRSTAPHLHYEVWVHDQMRNPIEYILDEYRSFG